MARIGNRFIESDLRDWLEARDHYGRSAQVEELELAAVERPGWVQVFRFRVRAKNKSTGEWDRLAGLIRDDERVKRKADRTRVRLTASPEEHAARFAEWSDGLIVHRPGDRRGEAFAVAGVVLGLLAALVAGVLVWAG